MIQLSVQKLAFEQEEKKKAFTITNNSTMSLLFKIKSTSLRSVDIYPTIGQIKRGKSLNILVTRKIAQLKNVKIQINSTVCEEPILKQNFSDLWEKYSKKCISHIIDIQCYKNSSQANLEQSSNLRKSQNQPLFQSMHLRQSRSLISSIKSDSVNFSDGMNSYDSTQKLKLIRQKAQKSKQINKKLEVEVRKASKFVKQVQRNPQPIYQEYVQPCNHIHVSNKTLILFLMLIFCIGFLVGKQILLKR